MEPLAQDAVDDDQSFQTKLLDFETYSYRIYIDPVYK